MEDKVTSACLAKLAEVTESDSDLQHEARPGEG